MSSTGSGKAVQWLERDYDNLYPRNTRAMFTIKRDGYDSCDSGSRCADHVGEADYTHGAILYEGYGYGKYVSEMGYEAPCYGIPLIEDHWKRPCP